jgi:hypothetical protein
LSYQKSPRNFRKPAANTSVTRGLYSRLGIPILLIHLVSMVHAADELRPVALRSEISSVQPMTGIALWSTNPAASTAPIQLEFAYLKYDQVVREEGKYDWSEVEKLLDDIATRRHQAILRWHDTYVGKPNGVPDYIKSLQDYRATTALSEKQPTGFPDWSHPELRRFMLEFFTRFAERYDRDPRISFVQVGFGLWSEYHIYDGPMQLGTTFPDRAFQAEFARHLASQFRQTPWMISVDAAGDHAPFASDDSLRDLPFGLFDDSFNHRRHKQENEPNWIALGIDRWKIAPTGGEFSFFEAKDQRKALSVNGPHGVPFDMQAAKFHVSFIIGDDQPNFQTAERIRMAGLACGYRFRVTRFECNAERSRVTIDNVGIAPIYHDAYPAIHRVRSKQTLKGLLPGASQSFEIESGGSSPVLTIQSDRLVQGQEIQFEAALW